MKFGTYTATVNWNMGTLGKVSAKKKVKINKVFKADKRMYDSMPANAVEEK
jgi:hypothetical protein